MFDLRSGKNCVLSSLNESSQETSQKEDKHMSFIYFHFNVPFYHI